MKKIFTGGIFSSDKISVYLVCKNRDCLYKPAIKNLSIKNAYEITSCNYCAGRLISEKNKNTLINMLHILPKDNAILIEQFLESLGYIGIKNSIGELENLTKMIGTSVVVEEFIEHTYHHDIINSNGFNKNYYLDKIMFLTYEVNTQEELDDNLKKHSQDLYSNQHIKQNERPRPIKYFSLQCAGDAIVLHNRSGKKLKLLDENYE